jgi:hypothetical protein
MLAGTREACAQALSVTTLRNGTRVVLVTQPLADATSCVWDSPAAQPGAPPITVVSGALTLAVDLEAALASSTSEELPAPTEIVVVGSVAEREVMALLNRLLDSRPPASRTVGPAVMPREGGTERRLGAPGADAELHLTLPLPDPVDARRTDLEVLWELLPEVLAADFPGVQGRVESGQSVLTVRVDPELADVSLRRLRLALARLAAEPQLDETTVGVARRRLTVRRAVVLEDHPGGAETVLGRLRSSGLEGVREYLFGPDGVTVDSVREAVGGWLPRHPGAATLVLPPRVFNPRFAPGPINLRLESDLAVTILERAVTPLSVLVLRPVVLPDVDGALAATVLARLAAELRQGESSPGSIQVHAAPLALEIAAPGDAFPELVEVLQRGLSRLDEDERVVTSDPQDARRRTLDLLAGVLGLAHGDGVSPVEVLRRSNLAIGAVVPDGEVGADALRKLLSSESGLGSTEVGSLQAVPRTRDVVAGRLSTLAVVVDIDPTGGEAVEEVVEEIIRSRAAVQFTGAVVEVLRPLVPGRHVVVVLITIEDALDRLEAQVAKAWPKLVGPVADAELESLRRRVAAQSAARWSGATGRARRCAAVAAGELSWRAPADLEMAILGVGPAEVADALVPSRDLKALETAGAGVLPLPK